MHCSFIVELADGDAKHRNWNKINNWTKIYKTEFINNIIMNEMYSSCIIIFHVIKLD